MTVTEAFSKHTKTGVRLTDEYVEIVRPGGFFSTLPKGTKRIPIRSISAVQLRKNTTFVAGFIQFTIPGGNESTSGTFNAASDENSVLFRKDEEAEFRAFEQAVQAAITAAHRPAPSTSSLADELIKLAGLRDAGVLTEPEFAAQKARLLGA